MLLGYYMLLGTIYCWVLYAIRVLYDIGYYMLLSAGTVCYYVHCLVLWVMLRFNWKMYCCHGVSAQLRQYEITNKK